MRVRYSSNNSGGEWWLNDKDWKALEAAGWEVKWFRDSAIRESGRYDVMANARKTGRWLGALAAEASKEFETPADAIREWEKITGKDAGEDGCSCC